ncbi:MAG TPA: sigma 54-interacting transcriptional regulator [Labilithrix sp.]
MGERREDDSTHTLGSRGAPRIVVFWDGGWLATEIPTHGELVVGRAVGSGIWIDHPSVSRQHAVLRPSGDGALLTIEDLGSANGTKVGGRRLAPGERAPLGPGVVAELGVARILVDDATTDAPAAAPVAEAPIDAARRLVALAAPSTISVLLLGETGVGKEVFAEDIHRLSPRAARALVRLNCAALPETLLESELFGYERGAFSGALTAKQGLLEAANGGTLFLDEIGELPESVQVKLLRVLERREVMRLGSVKTNIIDVRFVAATHANLQQAIAEGTFRKDLFFRLAGITIAIPPLRDRPTEVVPLARRFLAEARTKLARAPLALTADAETKLARHAWPGNVRELKNVMERAAVLCAEGAVGTEHVVFDSLEPSASPSDGSLPSAVLALEKERIAEALARSQNNQTQAAKLLGISRRALINRLEEYGFPRPRKR